MNREWDWGYREHEPIGWTPVWGLGQGLNAVAGWYRRLRDSEDMHAATLDQIRAFQYPQVSTTSAHWS